MSGNHLSVPWSRFPFGNAHDVPEHAQLRHKPRQGADQSGSRTGVDRRKPAPTSTYARLLPPCAEAGRLSSGGTRAAVTGASDRQGCLVRSTASASLQTQNPGSDRLVASTLESVEEKNECPSLTLPSVSGATRRESFRSMPMACCNAVSPRIGVTLGAPCSIAIRRRLDGARIVVRSARYRAFSRRPAS